jgi:methionyl-tRNA formyltransferase
MKITVFTSNQPRHLHLIKQLEAISDECHAIIECNTVFPGEVDDFFRKSEVMQVYFANVIAAERKIFGQVEFVKKTRTLSIKSGDLNRLDKDVLADALQADIYVVFGASYIKGWLAEFLVNHTALNIHMGISPYYRGSSCNFWALYDNNPHLVGATIHMLSKGLDSGDMLFHVLPTTANCDNPFEFTMQSVAAAHKSLVDKIADGSIFQLETLKQDKSQEIRYTRNRDFTDKVAAKFLAKNISINEITQRIRTETHKFNFLRCKRQ